MVDSAYQTVYAMNRVEARVQFVRTYQETGGLREMAQWLQSNHTTVELALPNLIVERGTRRGRRSSWGDAVSVPEATLPPVWMADGFIRAYRAIFWV